jgi:flagellar hook-associated protein 1 FlgK
MSVLNIATRALLANQTVLQTTGNNIANVNTPGYSRQTAVLQTIEGQYSGSGYIGKGVDVLTIQRNYSQFLTRQSALASATSAGDTTRSDKLKQLESIFPGGTSGLGAAVNDMLNAFSDVASAPTDLTARTVALTRVSETASRMRSASQSLDDLQLGVKQEIAQKVDSINTLAKSIANVNDRIARAQGSGQSPNDLLDQRDQLIRDLNQYVQTSSIPATDGTVGIFLAGSQALVLGSTAASLTTTSDDYNDPLKTKVALLRTGQSIIMDENMLGGGSVSGLLKFQNTDLAEGRNLLGRLTLAISTSMNDQHKLGLDLDGKLGGNLFTPTVFGSGNILQPAAPATLNSITAGTLTLATGDVTKFAASDYVVNFSTATTGSVTRLSDGISTAFQFTPGNASQDGSFLFSNPATGNYDVSQVDGLKLGSVLGSAPAAGDRFLLKPFSTSASNISAEFSTPRALAVASPIAGKMGTTNTGSLQLTSLLARSNPPTNVPVSIRFTGPNTYIRSDEFPALDFNNPANFASFTPYVYTSGQAIEYSQAAKYPTSAVPFSATATSLLGNPPFSVDNLTITNPAAVTGETYTINVSSVGLDPVLGAPWGQATYTITGSTSGTSGPFASPAFNYNLPISIPISNPSLPGLSMNLTGDVRSGASVTIKPASYTEPVLSNWSLTLQGSPKAGDTFTIFDIKDSTNNNGINLTLNAGNANAMMGLRDTAMFDGSALTDGYASMISQIGIRTQSANYSADVSSSIAANLEKDRTGVSGVNLDEEASKLLQYQQAYQASAKVIQIAQGMFDTLMQTFR